MVTPGVRGVKVITVGKEVVEGSDATTVKSSCSNTMYKTKRSNLRILGFVFKNILVMTVVTQYVDEYKVNT